MSATVDLIVRDKVTEADGVVSLTLEAADGAALPPWEPGAHIDVDCGSGLERQYSLCGDPGDRTVYQVAVLREPAGRGGSAYIHDHVDVGAVVQVGGPRNHFELVPSSGYLFIAGGIGITPILPMIARAEAERRDWRLVYGGRSRTSMAFVDRLREHGDRVSVRPQDEQGLLDLDALLADLQQDTKVYCCGPESLLKAVEATSAALPPDALRVERFAPRQAADAGDGDRPLEVVCERSAITVQVGVAETILEAVRAAGVDVDSSCEEGICGTCEARVLEGRPDHRDSLLSEVERRAGTTMMICCSRALDDRLVLDL